jgi:uncharacterized protein (TIGR00303 family)
VRGEKFVRRCADRRASFWCVLAHTDTCLLPGVSAAGVSEDLRPLTPAADAEVVCLGRPVCLPRLPSNPLGAAGPSGITRAALRLASIEPTFIATGLRVWPQAPHRVIEGPPGGRIDRGHAVPNARELYATGLRLGEGAQEHTYLVLAESIPGGTTTALSMLLALGYDAEGRVSGSMPGNSHALKSHVARQALDTAGLASGDGRADALAAVAQIGDPMQPLVAGIAVGASAKGVDVLLAGGSQMLAVAALIAALVGDLALERIAIGTTSWVVNDPSADVAGLATDINGDLPLIAANLSFARSRHAALRSYEDYMVKEGVGAGGASIAALLATGMSIEHLEACIDTTYDEVLA